MGRIRLGVNVDHVATIRQQRGTRYPDPVIAATLAEMAGADQITVHLREDRRHIQERDVRILRETVTTALNLEMAMAEEIIRFACEVKPDMVCLVPERREEKTTEGGLGVVGREQEIGEVVKRLKGAGILVSLFINPDVESVRAAARCGAPKVEIHTGRYADARDVEEELARVASAAREAKELGLEVAAGHGLDYKNCAPVCRIPEIEELNIGHSIIARALFVGIKEAVREMIDVIASARGG